MRPLIGVTSSIQRKQLDTLISYEPIARAIDSAGGLPVVIPCTLSDDALHALFNRLDGVLLPGGGDIDSAYWNEPLHPSVKELMPERDHAEILLTRWSYEAQKPIFGICRGHQVMNVALGGTLIQDIDSYSGDTLKHDYFLPNPRNSRTHMLNITPDSRMAQLLGVEACNVNSIHHQAVGKLAPMLRATATTTDGIVEALEATDHPFLLSVQWHPEDLAQEDASQQALFDAFIEACR